MFVSLVLLGCLIRTYIRTANGEKEDEVHFWSSPFSQLEQHGRAASSEKESTFTLPADGAHRPRSTNTSSGEANQAVSVLDQQPPCYPPLLAEIAGKQDSRLVTAHPASIQTYNGSEVDEAYEDWAAMHHARGAVSEDAETSIDNLLQRRQLHKAMRLPSLRADLDALDANGPETPTIWTAHFPAAQLRPY